MKLPHHRKYIYGIFHSFPLFTPRQCVVCKHDFVRESMWRFVGKPFINKTGTDHYICKGCAPSKNVAHKVACNDLFGPLTQGRPSHVPPPTFI